MAQSQSCHSADNAAAVALAPLGVLAEKRGRLILTCSAHGDVSGRVRVCQASILLSEG
jgi:hypothetical protein